VDEGFATASKIFSRKYHRKPTFPAIKSENPSRSR